MERPRGGLRPDVSIDRLRSRGRLSARARLARLGAKRWQIVQCAVAAGVAWLLATEVLGHTMPFFAPVAAVVSLGTSYSQRLRRVAEVTLGVAVGVLLADLLVSQIGAGAWQIAVVVLLAMSAAFLLDGGQLFVTQSAIQSIFIVVLVPQPGQALSRWTDALIGGAVALVAATVVPAAPLRRPREQAAVVVRKIAGLLRAAAEVMVDGDGERGLDVLFDARSTDNLIAELREAAREGMSVVASSPFRVRHRPGVRQMADLVEPLDRALRSTRVLVRQTAVAAYHHREVPRSYARLAIDLAGAAELVGAELAEGRMASGARDALLAVGEDSGDVERAAEMTAEVVLAQLRSLVADLLLLTGMTPMEATDALPAPAALMARPRAVLPDRQGPDEQRWVLHVDLDQFLAAVEVLRRPELAGRAVVVGGDGDPTKRGVVATASYEARALGVGSGMPLRLALRKAQDAVFLPVDRPAYDAASAAVMATLRSLEWAGRPVVLQVLGWDEAFLAAGPDDAAHEPADDPVAFAAHVRRRVLETTGLHCSVGIGDNKLRAKIATDLGKPRGTFQLTAQTWSTVMGERPTTSLWGVGAKTAAKLAALGITTVTELGAADVTLLAETLGPTMGPWYRRLGRGVDTSPVDATPWVARAHGRETTFQSDLDDWAQVAEEVRALTRQALADIDADGRPAARVGLKVRFAPFSTVQRSLTLPAPTRDVGLLEAAATSLLDRVDHDRPVRLLGVRLEMVDPA